MSSFDKNTFLPAWIVLNWVAGLSLGVFADRFYGEAYRAYLLLAPHRIPDFFGAVCMNMLPLLISAYAVCFIPKLLSFLCLIRGMLTGLGISGVAALYGCAGVPVASLLLFRFLLFNPLLLWYWMRREESGCFLQDTLWCILIGMVLSWLDCALVAPILREIMIF